MNETGEAGAQPGEGDSSQRVARVVDAIRQTTNEAGLSMVLLGEELTAEPEVVTVEVTE